MDRKPVRLTIYNQTFSLIAQGDPSDLERAAETVDRLMHSIAAKAPSADTARVAVLACLHLADKLHSINSLVETVD